MEPFQQNCSWNAARLFLQRGGHWTAGRNPLLEWGDLRRRHSPGHVWECWLWEEEKHLDPASSCWGLCLCCSPRSCHNSTFPWAFTSIADFFFSLETRSVLLIIINKQNNKQIISSEQKFLLPAVFSWEGQWRMNQEREWPFLNVTCQRSERLVVTVPCRARALCDSTDCSLSFLPKPQFFLGQAKSRAKQASAKYP